MVVLWGARGGLGGHTNYIQGVFALVLRKGLRQWGGLSLHALGPGPASIFGRNEGKQGGFWPSVEGFLASHTNYKHGLIAEGL